LIKNHNPFFNICCIVQEKKRIVAEPAKPVVKALCGTGSASLAERV